MSIPSISSSAPHLSFTTEPTFPEFEELLPELKKLIVYELDLPTRFSFSQTCRKYQEDHGDKNFDCFKSADQCAELGYKALLEYSVEHGAPFDKRTAEVAARYGHVEILEMYRRRERMGSINDLCLDKIDDQVREWAGEAASLGNLRLLNWVRIDEWRNPTDLKVVAVSACSGGQVDLAVNLIDRSRKLALSTGQKFDYYRSDSHIFARYGLEKALAFRQLVPEETQLFSEKHFQSIIFYEGCELGLSHLVSWSLEQDPTLLTEKAMNSMIATAIRKGFVDNLKIAERNDGKIGIETFEAWLAHNSDDDGLAYLPHFSSLWYLHKKFSLTSCPFPLKFAIPWWATDEAMQWMTDRGYQFEIKQVLRPNCTPNPKLISWILEHGVKMTSRDILEAACHRRIDILDLLWQAKPKELKPDSATMESFVLTMRLELSHLKSTYFDLERVRVLPIFKTLRWLLDKGYTWGTSENDLQIHKEFITEVCKHKQDFYKAIMEKVTELNMPFSKQFGGWIQRTFSPTV